VHHRKAEQLQIILWCHPIHVGVDAVEGFSIFCRVAKILNFET
jgi:hypothetical protein